MISSSLLAVSWAKRIEIVGFALSQQQFHSHLNQTSNVEMFISFWTMNTIWRMNWFFSVVFRCFDLPIQFLDLDFPVANSSFRCCYVSETRIRDAVNGQWLSDWLLKWKSFARWMNSIAALLNENIFFPTDLK